MEKTKTFVNKNNLGTFKCPYCAFVKKASVESLKGRKHSINVKCICGKSFGVILDFRQNYRKGCELKGVCKIFPTAQQIKKAEQDKNDSFHRNLVEETPSDAPIFLSCTIIDISLTGVRIQLEKDMDKIEVGRKMSLSFTLDNKGKTQVQREILIVVKDLDGNFLGCKYLDPELYYKEMGFYLLP